MTVAVRFAPSPTGRLHVGNIRMALVNWLFARRHGGSFLLRLDDTDTERSRAEHAQAIETDLAWLGLAWDRFARQTERLDAYGAAAERLRAGGLLYPCYETAEDLAEKRATARRLGRPPRYDRAALGLDDAARARLEASGRRPHWRFRLPDAAIGWHDLVRGPVQFAASDLSDPVVLREDGQPLYQFSSVVDDVDLGITHVIRGEDHVANTAVQIALWQALTDRPAPMFGHLTLLVDAQGQGLSKRLGSLSVGALRQDGIEPMAINSLLARLGTADPIMPFARLDQLVEGFEISRFSRATPHFDPAELARLNHKILGLLEWRDVAPRLEGRGLDGLGEGFWLAVRGNLQRFGELEEWWRVATGPTAPAVEDPDFLARAAALLPAGQWDGATWAAWTAAVKAATGRTGKALFLPLRRALTGRDHGPEMAALLPVIGRERAVARLAGQTA